MANMAFVAMTIGYNFWTGYIGSLLLFFLFFTDFYWISVAYAIWYIVDSGTSSRGGRLPSVVKSVRNLKVWKHFAEHFPVQLVKTAELDTNRNYLICAHPHGVLCHGIFANFATEATNFAQKFPGITPHVITISTVFQFPVLREIALIFGKCDASDRSLKYILKNKGRCREKGQAVVLVVGGLAEQVMTHPGKNQLYLKYRSGFCRVALQTGAALVPVYSFGENDIFSEEFRHIYSQLDDFRRLKFPKAFHLPTLFNYTKNFVKLAIAFHKFQLYLTFILPFKKSINTVVGQPIHVTKCESPSNEQIAELHHTYITALTKLFDEHKAKYAKDPNARLEII